MRVIAIPNPAFPPGDEALAGADVVLGSLAELTPEAVERLVTGLSVTGLSLDTATRPNRTQPLWPPRPIAFDSATSTCTRRASFGT